MPPKKATGRDEPIKTSISIPKRTFLLAKRRASALNQPLSWYIAALIEIDGALK